MQILVRKKSLVFGIILLLVGIHSHYVSCLTDASKLDSTIEGYDGVLSQLSSARSTTLFLKIPAIPIDILRMNVRDNGCSWGFILSTKFALSYQEIWQNISDQIVWWGAPVVELTVIGIGTHTISYTCNYSIYTYDTHVPQPQNGSFNSSTDLYLFNLHKKPVMKIKASITGSVPFFLFKKGTWTGKLYIDGTLVETQQCSYEHH